MMHGPAIEPLIHHVVTAGAVRGAEEHGPIMVPKVQREPVRLPLGEDVGPPLGVVMFVAGNGAAVLLGAAGLEVKHGPVTVPPVQRGRFVVTVPTGLAVDVFALGQLLEGRTIHGPVIEPPLQIGTVAGADGAVPTDPEAGMVVLLAGKEVGRPGPNDGRVMQGTVIFPLMQ